MKCLKLGLILLFVGACSKPEPSGFDAGASIAVVNGDVLDEQFFFDSYIDWLNRTGYNDDTTARYIHLDNAIDVILLAQEARTSGMMSSQAYLDYERVMRDGALGGRFLQAAVFDTMGSISESQLRDAFEKSNRKVYVRQLFFNDESQAQRYHSRLLAGEDFVVLANELYQTSVFDSTAGFMDDISYFGVDDAFAEAAFKLGMFEFSEPVRTRQGWVIIRVENMNRNPILTESAFQNRRKRLYSLLMERKVNLLGDAFVRGFMQDLQPAIQDDVYRQLEPYLTGLTPDARIAPSEFQVIQQQMEPTSVLVLYRYEGETREFMVSQFMKWLPYLPYSEVRTRPGAAIGRALRNEVFAQAGQKAGYASDPKVRWQMNYVTTFRLANDIRATIPSDSLLAETIRELREKADIRVDTDVFRSLAPMVSLPRMGNQ
jgi:hypothetical protein